MEGDGKEGVEDVTVGDEEENREEDGEREANVGDGRVVLERGMDAVSGMDVGDDRVVLERGLDAVSGMDAGDERVVLE